MKDHSSRWNEKLVDLSVFQESRNIFSEFLLKPLQSVCVKTLNTTVETLVCSSCSHSIPRSPILPLLFVELDSNTENVDYYSLK